MEIQFVKHLISSTFAMFPMRLHLHNSVPKELVGFPLFRRRAVKQAGYATIIPHLKRSLCQDFQGFAKPSRLLLATGPYKLSKYVSDEIISSVEVDETNSFYMIELNTSKDAGSCMRDLNGAILLSLIDVNGDSILHRISAVSMQHTNQGDDESEIIHFQRGSGDVVTFKGPKLGKIDSIWIGLESGSWRLDGISLTVINKPKSLSNVIDGTKEADLMQYKFEASNILLGEGGESIAELRPQFVTESSTENISNFYKISNHSPSISPLSNEESMKEYSDLKFSLLLYDSLLFTTGSTILLAVSHEERYAYSFFIGGFVGFFYLLLLQRSVDGLSTDGELENFAQGISEFKGPLFILALILVTSVVAVKHGIGGSSIVLTPAELFIGAAGFLSCKIAVLLAAFKPIKKVYRKK